MRHSGEERAGTGHPQLPLANVRLKAGPDGLSPVTSLVLGYISSLSAPTPAFPR